MANAIDASLLHVASTDENRQHHLRPKGKDIWCGYQSDSKTYTHRNGIPKPIVDLIHPVYEDLSKSELLNKCTHGLTQNANECWSGKIWGRCPRSTYVEQETVALATYLAVLKFNDGDISLLKIFEDLDISPGLFTCKGFLSGQLARYVDHIFEDQTTLCKMNLSFGFVLFNDDTEQMQYHHPSSQQQSCFRCPVSNT